MGETRKRAGVEMMTKDRKIATCANGHRSTVPENALLGERASSYRCPECGLGIAGPSEHEIGSAYWFERRASELAEKASCHEDAMFYGHATRLYTELAYLKHSLEDQAVQHIAEIETLRAALAQAEKDRDEARAEIIEKCESIRAWRDQAQTALAATTFIADEGVYSDSYGVPGSDFTCCRFCQAGGAPGIPFKHDDRCPILRCEEVAADWLVDLEETRADLSASLAREAKLREERDEACTGISLATPEIVAMHEQAAKMREALKIARPYVALSRMADDLKTVDAALEDTK